MLHPNLQRAVSNRYLYEISEIMLKVKIKPHSLKLQKIFMTNIISFSSQYYVLLTWFSVFYSFKDFYYVYEFMYDFY